LQIAGSIGSHSNGRASAAPTSTNGGYRALEIAAMNFSALEERCARVPPSKLHIALPLLIMGVVY
jgi:hypothetical protein